jgi:hypothetical protein
MRHFRVVANTASTILWLVSITLLSIFLLRRVFFCKMAPWSGTGDFGNAALSDSKRLWCRLSRRWAEVSGGSLQEIMSLAY